ncbi:MAG: hypothetical protein MR011_06165 [Lachnospiraceae bacterium]|nr:hypothetical protein [Lachnospiraceae bacterium]
MIAHCMFEQSGTFKNEFKKLGIEAYDYDLQDEFGETDYKVDLFDEIKKAYEGWESIFDRVGGEDIIMAFFPCTRFEAQISISFRGEATQQKKWTDLQKLQYCMKLHSELHMLYERLCQLVVVAERKELKMVIENPYTQPHYLTTYWCIKPTVIDKNRTDNGDFFKKPTQFFFINLQPSQNLVFEPLEYTETKVISKVAGTDKTTRQTERSMMHPQYARRFIKQYILPRENV